MLVFPQGVSAKQEPTDSLRSLIETTIGKRKGELNLELANLLLAENPDSSIYYGSKARAIGKEENDHVLIIRSYSVTGEAYQRQNKLKEAIASYLKGLELAEKYKEKSLAGTIYNGIGVCYFYLNDVKKAEQYMKRAARAKKDANDYQYYALIAINLAGLQIMNQSFDESVLTLKEAEKTLLKKKQDQYLATVYNSLGAAYQSVKPDSCVYYYELSLKYSTKHKDYLTKMNAYQNLGDYYFDRKEYSRAIDYMKLAIATNEKRPEDSYKPSLYQRISALYDSIGDFKHAYSYKKLETEARQRVFSVEKQKQIEELEIKYQSEKKEKEIQQNKQELERKNNQQNILVFCAVSLFLVAGFITYLIFQRKRIERQFEKEKLRLFENIFHEIRTPLTLIDGPIQVMKLDTAYPEELVLMERNSKKLINLVNELLDASKLGKGSYQLDYTNGNLIEFIENVIETFSGEAKIKAIQINYQPNELEAHYSFPSNALEKILSNLIGNAVKYCPAKSVISVSSEIKGNKLQLKVADDGPGIPKKDQKKVFRRFFRGKHTSDLTGTGIGLSLVKELIELTGGMIELQSSGVGTEFRMEIPVGKKQNEEVSHSLSTLAKNEDLPVLLLVEDDADMAAFSMSVLKEEFNIIHAKNGSEGLDLIRENLPDIVLSDVMMPEKDGIELLHDIRSDELTNHLPFVLFSAKASLESRLEGLQHGADAYVSKPFSPEELKLTILNLFSTVQRNKEAYNASILSEKTFEERVRSRNSYVNKVIECIVRHMDDSDYSVNELSNDMAVSRSQLHRKLSALTGFSTTNFIRMIRLEKAKDLLLNGDGNITEIAYKCGFSSQSYFTKSFTEHFGKSPSQIL
ncbi:integral membrane sensor hybrid histidine kinase [Fluviicola taffensis DSM 16823]|uniref:histidine kinase n=2 Tax=Fluviicola TaxID=332102 RepID=F2IAZ7_FLUTR|nr:integral membrane sensor hybrid histidine kinase [Fluviicola taffensis DSM 16823]